MTTGGGSRVARVAHVVCDSYKDGVATMVKGDKSVGSGPDLEKPGGDSPISDHKDGIVATIVMDVHCVSALVDAEYENDRIVHT